MENTSPENEIDYKRVMTVLTADLLSKLGTVAKRKTMSRSLLIRMACERFLQDEEAVKVTA